MERPDFFQANLARLMMDRGWSLKRLAAESGTSYHTVFRAVSKGVIPRGGNQEKLAKALGVTVSDLHVDPRNPPVKPKAVEIPAEDLKPILESMSLSAFAALKKENSEIKARTRDLPQWLIDGWSKLPPKMKIIFQFFVTRDKKSLEENDFVSHLVRHIGPLEETHPKARRKS